MSRIIGLDRVTRGQKLSSVNADTVGEYTGYFQYESTAKNKAMYWQILNADRSIVWLKIDQLPVQVDYEGEL